MNNKRAKTFIFFVFLFFCFSVTNGGDPIHKISLNNNICEVGMPCDDNDRCTINDKYNEDCECLGEFPKSIIVQGDRKNNCDNQKFELSVANPEKYYDYTWSTNGSKFSTGSSSSIDVTYGMSGFVKLEVITMDECYYVDSFYVLDYENLNFLINTTSEALCGNGDEAILSIDEKYKTVVWTYNGDEIKNSNSNFITVSKPGIYKVKGMDENCEFWGAIRIVPTFEFPQILPRLPIICDNKPELYIKELLPDQKISWQFKNEIIGEDSIFLANEIGKYTVQVENSDGCVAIIKKEVFDVNDPSYLDLFSKYYFEIYDVKIISKDISTADQNEEKNKFAYSSMCTLLPPEDYVVQFLDDGSKMNIKHTILSRVENYLSCDPNRETIGFFIDDVCDGDALSQLFDGFSYENYFLIFLDSKEVGEITKLYIKNNW